MLDTSRMLKKNLLKRDQVKVKRKGLVGTKGRPKSTAEERKVRLEIIELLQATKGKRRKGRPRKKQGLSVSLLLVISSSFHWLIYAVFPINYSALILKIFFQKFI